MTPMPSRALPVLLACALGASACRTDSPDQRYTVRDSAGVHYVEHRTLDSLPARKAGADAAIRIGAVEGEVAQPLDLVLAGAVLSDGRIVLLNAGTHQVRYYDSTGALVASQGAEGDGPEEYRSPTTLIATAGDSVVVWDVAHKRATVLAPDGKVARSTTLAGELRYPLLAGVFDGGYLLVYDRSLDFVPGAPMQTEMGHDLIFAPTGEQQGRIGNHPVRTVQLMSGGQPVTALGPQNQVEIRTVPFAPETQRAARADGYWIGRQQGPEIAFLDATGKVRTLVRWLGQPVATTKTDMQGYVDRSMEAATSEEQRAALRTQGAAYFQYAATLPPHGPLVAGADGALWMNQYHRPGVGGPERWTVFGPDGVAREEVELPEGSTLLWASPARVLLLLRDELGVERVEVRRLG